MTSTSNVHEEFKTGDAPIALIDSLDVIYTGPLREYLEANGCVVVVNQQTTHAIAYHIVCGDREFVKQIFADSHSDPKGTLVVLWEGDEDDAKMLAKETRSKVLLTDQPHLSSRAVNEIFAYFFTSDKQTFIQGIPGKATVSTKQEHPTPHPDTSHHDDVLRIKESIQTIFKDTKKGDTHHEKHQHQKVNKDTNLLQRKKLFSVILLSAFIVLPIFWYILSLSISTVGMYYSAKSIQHGDGDKAKQYAGLAGRWSTRAKDTIFFYSPILSSIGLGKFTLGQEHILSFYDNAIDTIAGASTLLSVGKSVAGELLAPVGTSDNSNVGVAVAIEKLSSSLLLVQNRVGLSQAELQRLLVEAPFPLSIPVVFENASRVLGKLRQYSGSMNTVSNFLDLYPKVAGFKDQKTYLVLLQNSMELRPTGGFIGSIAVVTVSEGRVLDLSLQDVYVLDGQLKGHVDPPGPIRDLLGQEHWYLRDSNWDPDFTVSGEKARWFYEKETGTNVDGVIALSLPVIIDLLKVTGPLDLPDYNDRITADNFFGKSLYYTHTNFFPGSTQKKDFLGSLTSALLTKIVSNKSVSPTALFTAVSGGLTHGDILLYFTDRENEAMAGRFLWTGAMTFDGHGSDTASVIEANLGVNKANYYIDRTILQQTALTEEGSAREAITVSYHNTGETDHPASGGGAYKTYTRFYIPKDAQSIKVVLDGKEVPVRDPKKKGVPDMPFIEPDSSHPEATIVGVAFDIPLSSERKLLISYTRQHIVSFIGSQATYESTFYRQPGTIRTHFQKEVTFPIFWKVDQTEGAGSISFLAKEGRLEYNSDLTENQTMKLQLSK